MALVKTPVARKIVLNDVLPKLRALFNEMKGVKVAILFGSIARDGASSHDVDIALLGEENLLYLGYVVSKVAEALGISEDRVDVVSMNQCNPILLSRMLGEGVLIKGEPEAIEKLLDKAQRSPDAIIELRMWSNIDPKLDKTIITSRVEEIRRDAGFIKSEAGSCIGRAIRDFMRIKPLLKGYILDLYKAPVVRLGPRELYALFYDEQEVKGGEYMASVAMINDCAYVGETLIKYFPENIEIRHIKRTRSLWSKTLGIAYRIMRTNADVYHVHYLLQDCYIAGKLGKRPLIGHAHGSDLRASLNHPLWGRIVKYNLRRCDKILVSTPDILGMARQFRDDAIYLPNPVDMRIFYPRPAEKHERRRVLIASDSNWDVKGTDIAITALSRIKDKVDVSIIAYGKDLDKTLRLAEKLGLHLNVLPKVPHEELNKYYWNSDVIIDRFRLGSLGVVSLEAIACGRPVIAYVSSEYEEYKEFPLKDINEEEEIAEAVLNADERLWKEEYNYLMRNHNPENITKRVLEIYKEVIEGHDELLGI